MIILSNTTSRNKSKVLIELFHLLIPSLLIIGTICVLTIRNYISFIFSIVLSVLFILNLLIILFFIKKIRRVVFPCLAILVFLISFGSFIQFNFTGEVNDDSLSILTYNVNGIYPENSKFYKKKDKKIIDFVKSKNPDIVVFQEFWNFGQKFFSEYPYQFLGYRDGYTKSLQLILSKYPIKNTGYIDFPDTDNNAMYADIEYNNEVLRVYNIHLQSFGVKLNSKLIDYNEISSLFAMVSKSQKYRRNQVNMLKDHFKDFTGKVVIAGDFNSTQFSDTYKELKLSRRDTFKERGMGLGTTFSLLGYPLRLDFILTDKDFEIVSHENFDLKLSDHEPVMSRLKLK